MLFKGTRKRTAHDIAREIDAVGGILNAFTGKEYTCLYARVLRQDMDIAMDVLADMCKHSDLQAKDIEREKHVVVQEIKMIEDNPEEWIFDLFAADCYRGDPLGLPVLGVEESVQRLTKDQLVEHYRTHHSPIEHDHHVRRENRSRRPGAEGRHPVSRTCRERAAVPSPQKAGKLVPASTCMKRTWSTFTCAWPRMASARRTRSGTPFMRSTPIVGGSMSSHLFQEIREKRGLVYNIFSYVNCFNDAGNFGISTSGSPESMEEVIGLIRDESCTARRKRVSLRVSLHFQRSTLKGNFFISLEGSEAHMGRLAKNEIYFDRYVPVKETLKKIDGVR